MKQTLKIIAVSALATAAVIKAAPALSEPVTWQNVIIVRTSDLDLSTPGGRTELDRRLVNAAYEVCGTGSDVDLTGKHAARACRADVLAKARARSEQLAARAAPIFVAASR